MLKDELIDHFHSVGRYPCSGLWQAAGRFCDGRAVRQMCRSNHCLQKDALRAPLRLNVIQTEGGPRDDDDHPRSPRALPPR